MNCFNWLYIVFSLINRCLGAIRIRSIYHDILAKVDLSSIQFSYCGRCVGHTSCISFVSWLWLLSMIEQYRQKWTVMISLYKSCQTHTCNYTSLVLLTVFEIARRMLYSLMMNSNEQLHVGRCKFRSEGRDRVSPPYCGEIVNVY